MAMEEKRISSYLRRQFEEYLNERRCKISTQENEVHFNMSGGVPQVGGIGLTSDEKKYILNYHNEIRSKIALGEVEGQPPGKNIRRMTWDIGLQNMAQYWSNRRMNTYDSDISRVGQNLESIIQDSKPDTIKNFFRNPEVLV
ncbi:venom allergen 5-like [Lycorma delicatula]|uniref:venom allergen 5-like n=1 Tax=Lycorma delicatula TaxID=130591 RepID=UPI003F513C98